MPSTILARRGASTSVPTLDVGELGYLIDRKVLAVGDGTSSPSQIMTSKSTGLLDFSAADGIKFKSVWANKSNSSVTDVSIVLPATDGLTNTGIYSPALNEVGIAAGGLMVVRASATAVSIARNLSNTSTGYTKVAGGTTAQRAVSSVPGGEIRFNTEIGANGALEYARADGSWATILTVNPANGYGVAGGTANAITVTLDNAPTAYTNGMEARVKLTAGNTGAVTINVNGIGAKSVVLPDGSALAGGEMVTGMIARLLYDPALDAFQLTNALAVASGSSGSSGGSTDESPLTVKFTTRAAVQAGDVALLFADGTIAPATVANRDSLVNPLHQARDWRYRNVRSLFAPDSIAKRSVMGNSFLKPEIMFGTPMAQLNNGNIAFITTKANSQYPMLVLFSPGGDVLKELILDYAPIYNSTSNGTQVHVVALAGGGFAVSWAIWAGALPSSQLRCRYSVFDANGNLVTGPSNVGNVATTTTNFSSFGQRVVRMVALSGGGFGIFYAYAHESGTSTARTMLACTYNAAGVQQGSTLTLFTHDASSLTGPSFGVTGGQGVAQAQPIHDDNSAVIPLPNGNWAVCWTIYNGSAYLMFHAVITAGGTLTGTVKQFNNTYAGNSNPRVLRVCADLTDGSWYISFFTDLTTHGVVIAKISAANDYVSNAVLPVYPYDVVTQAIASRVGGGLVMLATRAYNSTSSATPSFIPASIYSSALTFNASLVQQTSKIVPYTLPDYGSVSTNYQPRMYLTRRQNGGYAAIHFPGSANSYYANYIFLDDNLDMNAPLLELSSGQQFGLEPKLTVASAVFPGEFVPHPDDTNVKVMPVLCHGSDTGGYISYTGVQIISDFIEARTIAGVVQADKGVGQQADVAIRGPVTTRLDFGAGFVFNYRGAINKIVGNTGWFLSNKGVLGGPQKAGVENKMPYTIALEGYRSWRVPRGYRFEGTHYASGYPLVINGQALTGVSGSAQGLFPQPIAAAEGDVIYCYASATLTGYLISA